MSRKRRLVLGSIVAAGPLPRSLDLVQPLLAASAAAWALASSSPGLSSLGLSSLLFVSPLFSSSDPPPGSDGRPGPGEEDLVCPLPVALGRPGFGLAEVLLAVGPGAAGVGLVGGAGGSVVGGRGDADADGDAGVAERVELGPELSSGSRGAAEVWSCGA
jgi:hypothetical protein